MAAQQTVTISGLRETQKALAELLARSEDAAAAETYAAAERLRGDAIKRLRAHGADHTGRLRNSIQAKRLLGANAEVRASAAYAAYIEFGTSPHFPPVAALQDWARLKLGLDEDQARSAAYAIQKAIGRRGTPERPYMQPAADAEQPRYLRALRQRLQRELKGMGL